ncbi:hypothetical protein PybrP1_005806 [[Pythium] brassicae (nom. inval.)]|nr:hypothetical protein PybrP1_005806 [[Pythium] brassicae (nom. inval.)]
MKYPLLRRFRLAELDREVARASMQICHKIVMQQLYISRADVRRQWVVISNPSEERIDLTGYSVASTDGSSTFEFPRGYTLLAGDQVTVWCSPGGVDLDTDNVLEPYLFWTLPDGSLRNALFFTPDATNEVLLLDPMMTEVASLKIYEDGKKEFRVLNCVSRHPTAATTSTRSTAGAQFCVGCLSPPELLEKQQRGGAAAAAADDNDDVYVFSRYWDVVSDKSLFAHFLGILVAPLVECVRAMLIYLLLSVFQTPRPRVVLGPQLRTKILRTVVLMTACDVITRRITLWIKSGLLVTVMSFASVLLDQLALVALYTSLEHLYPTLARQFRSLLCFELGISSVNMAAIQLGFLELRSQWHPAFKEISRWDHRFRHTMFLCGVGKELLTHLLLLLPLQDRPSLVYTAVGYLLVPLFTVATGMDFVRGVATLLHLLQYPWLRPAPKGPRGGGRAATARTKRE